MKNKLVLLSLFSIFLSSCNKDIISEISKDSISESITDSSTSNIESESVSTEEKLSSEVIDNGESEEVSKENIYYYFDENITLYINPSVQYSNLYTNNLGNEGKHMNDISILLVSMLDTYTNITVFSNNSMPGKSLSESVLESNNKNVDYHLALHSNAGGGKGSEIFYSQTSYNFSKSILDSLNEVLPYKTRGLKDGSKALYEIKSTKASACLLEILFHDEISQATFIVENKPLIAKAIYEGIVSYFLEK